LPRFPQSQDVTVPTLHLRSFRSGRELMQAFLARGQGPSDPEPHRQHDRELDGLVGLPQEPWQLEASLTVRLGPVRVREVLTVMVPSYQRATAP